MPDVTVAAPSEDTRESRKDSNSRRAAACLVCRRSKIRCEKGKSRHNDDDRCQRCLQLGVQCVRPEFHVGRRKGVKNKRTGLEKALHQVEQAVKRSGASLHGIEATKFVSELKEILGAGSLTPLADGDSEKPSTGHTRTSPAISRRPSEILMADVSEDSGDSSMSDHDDMSIPQDSTPTQSHVADESLAVDDAENPLQLLARASDLHVSPKPVGELSTAEMAHSHQHPRQKKQTEKLSEVEKFFKFTQFSLDCGPELDPIDLGLLTTEEAESLFDFFHKSLAHTRWGLDPILYTASFTRSRSAFLFTSICAAAALFMPRQGALSRRLSNHCKTLVNRIIVDRYRSVEIVLAFMVNVPWMFPGKHSTDDETCWYVSMATTMALDLFLHKIVVAMDAIRENGYKGGIARADCIDPKVALSLDGFGDVDPESELGRRLLRRRERCWIALFVLERGMCLARGRSYTVPVTPLLRRCDEWHMSDIADTMDGHLVSMAVLRRDLDDLFNSIRAVCDGSRETLADGGLVAQSIQMSVDKFFEQWHAKWTIPIGTGPQHRLPPYVQILVTHTRLSIYSIVINHPTAPTEVRHFFHAAGLSSALNVMRSAIQGEEQLSSMPNNTAIMISFAACFALRLSGQLSGGTSSLAPSVRTLIEETAGVLERIGTATDHRNGMSTLYGKYLKYIVKKAAAAAATSYESLASTVRPRNETAMTADRGPPRVAFSRHGGPSVSSSLSSSTLATYQRSSQQQGTSTTHMSNRNYGIPTDAALSATSAGAFLEPSSSTPSSLWAATEPILLQFSSMSDDQVLEALNNEFHVDPATTASNSNANSNSSMYHHQHHVGGSGLSSLWDDTGVLPDWLNSANLPEFGV
ncbi:hypothetical protein GE21DRAFT_10549 [Neurospora crassa]|uniref:Zn(2)-C6 fungal-type domain-containing protein n=1 Tax=Neurospora crassa (strain ATCC 24698 / 74-OR23-1A / CBS 708.71 / DSM 1257 / FGSC 987) TaxID=367110 RepID=Q7S4J5_NEUCR|nr:hypothetical protein NCU08136 [Neurospora crassa OR74A]EAA30443.2 hypothetical protein NCU08136 [Neurospora crassa OR74A]KHE79507.1 hypothetical protein GE21DRAFT_10549 [Neurospora crassa]|eukprot:XP_959679.2 hypothetical protein NCU08136 [Neurospora crassa OR74A]